MKKWSLLLLSALLAVAGVLVPATAQAGDLSFSVTLKGGDEDLGKVLFLGAMASFFSVDQKVVVSYHEDYNRPYFLETMSAFYLAGEVGRDPDEIIILRRKGQGWGEIAKRYGLNPNFHGKYMSSEKGKGKGKGKTKGVVVVTPMSDREFELFTFRRFIWEYYGVPEDVVIVWLNRGLDPYDIFISVNLGHRVHVEPSQIIALRLKGVPWEAMAFRYHVRYEELSKPAFPQHHYGKELKHRRADDRHGRDD